MGNEERGRSNRLKGLEFEYIVEITARLQGYFPVIMPLGAKRVGLKKLIQIKTYFDMILLSSSGSVGLHAKSVYLDCKSFEGKNLTFSHLTKHQVDFLARIEETGHRAGYIVHERKTNKVYFFSASILARISPGESVAFNKGEDLGSIQNLNLRALFENPLTSIHQEEQQLRQ